MSDLYAIAVLVIKQLREKGFDSYFVGGCARDMIMGKIPQDYDIATNASTNDVKKIFSKTVEVGTSFGVILVIYKGEKFQVSTYRGLSVTPQEDANLRDFTINGIFFDPIDNKIYDWVDGISDIKNKIIRAISSPHDRFEEDYIRMLRAVRLASNLNFEIEPDTISEIKKMAPSINLSSEERIHDELIKLFSGANPTKGLNTLIETGLAQNIIPQIAGLTKNGRLEIIKAMLSGAKANHYYLGISAVLSHLMGISYTHENGFFYGGDFDFIYLLKKYKFSNADIKFISNIIKSPIAFNNADRVSLGMIKKLSRSESFLYELEFYRLLLTAYGLGISGYERLKEAYASLSYDDIYPNPLITGDTLIGMGYKPSKLFNEILAQVELNQLNGEIYTKEQAIKWVLDNYSIS